MNYHEIMSPIPGDSSLSAGGEKRCMPAHASELPAKKQSKWSAEEDSLIIDLRGGGMWDDRRT
jgi:hypothetical protein